MCLGELIHFQRDGGGGNSVRIAFSSSDERSTLKGKKWLTHRRKCFRFGDDCFYRKDKCA